ncbi:hypothetical protein N7452_001633 [Penicillium brevicompactum]|uniref:F-box domain-containing protein n=1 Tax=Penicillium brevicompactum TaxID=5074 RepID=A0A9W9UQA1_PENBR|nr:hypothetical protein N7452_001633 [Penicillium brevicompactum]
MPASFLDLPGEIRNEIYKYLLVHDGTIKPWRGDHALSPNILATNKAILREGRSILYGSNCFDFTLWNRNPSWIEVFFGTIGIINMGYFRSIRIGFPRPNWGRGPFTIHEVSLNNIIMIGGFCGRLESVTITPISIFVLGNYLSGPPYPFELYGPVLAQVDSHFRVIPTLKQITVEAPPCLGMNLRKMMEGFGWVIRNAAEHWYGYENDDPNADENIWCPIEDDELYEDSEMCC